MGKCTLGVYVSQVGNPSSMPIKRQFKRFKVVLYLITFSPKGYIRKVKLLLVTINSLYVDVTTVYLMVTSCN